MTRLTTVRPILRPPTEGDAAGFIGFFASPRASVIGGPCAEHIAWPHFAAIAGHWALRRFGLFILEDKATGDAIGHAGAHQPGGYPEPEIAWTLWTDQAEARGLAQEACRTILAYTFGPMGWRTAVSFIRPGNTRSRALAKRLGATLDPTAARRDWAALDVFRHSAGGRP